MTLIEAAKLALYALEMGLVETFHARQENAITALRTAIAEAEKQEPVAWLVDFENGEQELHFDKQSVGETQAPLYTTPPAAQRQPLTEAEIADVWDKQFFDITDMSLAIDFVRDIEAAHGITGEKT